MKRLLEFEKTYLLLSCFLPKTKTLQFCIAHRAPSEKYFSGPPKISAHWNLPSFETSRHSCVVFFLSSLLRLIKRTSRAIYNLQSFLFVLSSYIWTMFSAFRLSSLAPFCWSLFVDLARQEYRINKLCAFILCIRNSIGKITNFWYNPKTCQNQTQIDKGISFKYPRTIYIWLIKIESPVAGRRCSLASSLSVSFSCLVFLPNA